jgi:2,3-bisphosphoglycerate-independent phosphoglycerate mutase
MKKQVALIILDGWGYREEVLNNAVAQAKTPVFDKIWNEYPHALLEASGFAVGLPEGQMGNSEVGHGTIGAGKSLDTDLVRINKSIKSGEFGNNPVLKKVFEHVKKNNSVLHIKGLVSKGGVHSHQDHLVAILRAAKENGIEKVAIHVFTDGRDTPPQSASEYIKEIEKVLEEVGIGRIVTLSGRFYAMDRDNNWDRVKKAEEAIFSGAGKTSILKVSEYLEGVYKEGKIDEHLEPVVFLDDKNNSVKVSNGDAIIFFNFRSDRARMLSKKITENVADKNILFATMTEYSKDINCDVVFPPTSIETVLAKEISEAGLTQAHIAETEKFPHVTYFFNGGNEKPYPREKHILLDSRKDVPTHDLAPKMRAEAIADKAIDEVKNGTNFILINFANPDMVGHTANVPAIIEAIEEVDTQLGRVLDVLKENGGVAFVTADHGNAEVNINEITGEKHTSHTTNPVPAVLTDKDLSLKNGGLADIAPTILKLLGLKKHDSMQGDYLI